MPGNSKFLPHIILKNRSQTEEYRARPGGGGNTPKRDRSQHAEKLSQDLQQVFQSWENVKRDESLQVGPQGRYIDLEATSKAILEELKSVECTSVKKIDNEKRVIATVNIPDEKIDFFNERVDKYASENTKNGKPRFKDLITQIEGFLPSKLESIFVGVKKHEMCVEDEQWWEIWVMAGQADNLRIIAKRLELKISERTLRFPDREVLLLHANIEALQKIWENSSIIAEIRLYRDTPGTYIHLPNQEQVEWIDELNTKTQKSKAADNTSILVLDSGINRAHPLLDPFIPKNGCLASNPTWGAADTGRQGHGTAMGGLVLYGDLHDVLRSTEKVEISHHLESAKILPPSGQNEQDLYGRITQEAVQNIERERPNVNRAICMAVTAPKDVFRGRPSAWSAALDQMAAGIETTNASPRLVIVSAGNNDLLLEGLNSDNYLDTVDTSEIHSPAQAWNALTIGAFTELTTFDDPIYQNWSPVASAGDLSPTSSTSVSWEAQWPLKPDVVFEGGNLISNGVGSPLKHSDIRLISTSDLFASTGEQIRDFGDTSGATALAAHMAGQLMARFPDFRPETIRALIVHSANWTPTMWKRLAGKRQQDIGNLVKRYGYGVPSLQRALHSLNNEVTLVIEDTFQPFDSEGKPHSMRLHELPWQLLDKKLGKDTKINMRVTLSYFIEPNPSERSYGRRFRYASHGLRFDVKGPLESELDFKDRLLSKRKKEDPKPDSGRKFWRLRHNLRTQGSLHSDMWEGDISELAACDLLAVYPVSGWWREKSDYRERPASYSLLVTLRASESIDLYTPIINALEIDVPTLVDVT